MLQPDAIGTAIAGGLTGLAVTRIWRDNRSSQVELNADEGAIRVALRRGYSEAEAAGHLLGAIETVAQIEGRSWDFNELIRCQNLRAISGISAVCPIVSGKIENTIVEIRASSDSIGKVILWNLNLSLFCHSRQRVFSNSCYVAKLMFIDALVELRPK